MPQMIYDNSRKTTGMNFPRCYKFRIRCGMAAIWLMSVVLVLLPNKLHSQSDFTFFNFTSFSANEQYPDLIFQGNAHIRLPSFTTISLTSPREDSVGRVLYSPAIRLWDRAGRRQATFQTVFQCVIGNYVPEKDGEGIAFFIAPVNATFPSGASGGNLGLYNPSTGISPVPVVAAEFDVFQNTWDPNYPFHLGININTRTSIAVAEWEEPWNWRVVDVRITYDSRERLITFVVTNPHSPFTRASVEHAIDLKTHLPEWVQIGISASSGGRTTTETAIQEIVSWSFISFMQHDDDTTDAHTLIRQYTSTD